jgi:hypothetical protein
MAEELAAPTIESVVGLGEGELIAPELATLGAPSIAPAVAGAETTGAGLTGTEALAPATVDAVAPAATTAASAIAPATADVLAPAATTAASATPTDLTTEQLMGTSGVEGAPTISTSASSTGDLPTDTELTTEQLMGTSGEEEASKKIAAEQGTQGFDATKALEYLGLTKPGGGLGGNALPAAALGLSQYRANKMGQSLQDQLKAASSQVSPVATGLISQYETGQINPAQEKQITDLTNNTKARIKQRYAQMGRDPNTDSAAQSELTKADADAVAMRDAAQQGILTQGLNAAGLAQGPATSAVMAGYQSDLQQQQAMQNFMNTLALMQSKQATT